MFTAMNVVRTAYHAGILETYPLDAATDVVIAVNKLLDVELAIMVRHYQLDSDEKLIARERRMQADRISAMQTMTAGLAHEVRNPLNAAKLQLELLERRLRREHDDPRLLEPSELAQKEIERLTELLNDFLAFARPPELHIQEHDVAAIIRHVCDLESVAAERRGAMLVLVVAPETMLARVDGPKISQVILNLVRNAVEAVTANGHVTVELTSTHDAFNVVVQDDGAGIPPEAQDKIFEPFFSTKEGGTGLGMSIVHSLVALHAGTIHFDSSARGTRFDVTIPRRQ
jgi:signal transduction histidine kinase